MKRGGLISGVAAGLLALAVTATVEAEVDPVLEARGWDEIVFDNLEPNRFSVPPGSLPPGEAVQVYSDSTVSVAFLNVEVDLAETPILEWEWLARDPDPDTDISKKGGDDRTLAVYIAFPWQLDQASFGERLQRPLVEALEGKDTPGRVITYNWGAGARLGRDFENPYAGKYGRMVILKGPDTELGTWHRERVDVHADFIEFFGFVPANPVYIGVGTDTDDTKSVMRAEVRGLRFVRYGSP